jgi:hypothetical protein
LVLNFKKLTRGGVKPITTIIDLEISYHFLAVEEYSSPEVYFYEEACKKLPF